MATSGASGEAPTDTSSSYRRGFQAGKARGSELGYDAGYRAGGEMTCADLRAPEEQGNVRAIVDYADAFRDGCLQSVLEGFSEGWQDGYRGIVIDE